jgi:hypothetical protein
VIIDAPLPTAPALADDRLFDELLTTLGLDPWPLAKTPRTTVLWRFVGGLWVVAGALLETNEALERGERMGDVRMTIAAMVHSQVRSNAATTRMVLAAPAPHAVVPDTPITLIVRDRTTDISGVRSFIASQPLVVEEVA